MHPALVVERDHLDVADGLAGAREEDIEDRQGAVDLVGVQVDLHLLGDEEGEAQDRAERALDIVERGADRTARQPRQIGHRTDRLQRAEHIGAGLGIEGVGVEEIRAAEHVEHGRPGRGQVDVGPAADLRELPLLELGKGAVEEFCVALPSRVLRQRQRAASPPKAACPRGSARCRRR